MKQLDLILDKAGQASPVSYTVKRMINAGYVGRNVAAVQAHIDELAEEGVPAPKSIPMIFSVLSGNITTEGAVEVLGDKTNGEAEFSILFDGDRILVGVGSDHTDRELETVSISMSKQIHENVMSQTVWDLEDLRSHWDELELKSWTRIEGSDEDILYQDATLGTIISVEDLISLVKSRLNDGDLDGLVVYSGTVPNITGKMIYGNYFRSELLDPVNNRTLVCEYRVHKLNYLSEE